MEKITPLFVFSLLLMLVGLGGIFYSVNQMDKTLTSPKKPEGNTLVDRVLARYIRHQQGASNGLTWGKRALLWWGLLFVGMLLFHVSR